MKTETAAAAEQQVDRRRILRRLLLFGIISLGLALLSRQTDLRAWMAQERAGGTAGVWDKLWDTVLAAWAWELSVSR